MKRKAVAREILLVAKEIAALDSDIGAGLEMAAINGALPQMSHAEAVLSSLADKMSSISERDPAKQRARKEAHQKVKQAVSLLQRAMKLTIDAKESYFDQA